MILAAEERKVVADFLKLFYDLGLSYRGGTNRTWAHTYWFGAPISKSPFDLWIYQDLIGQTKPDLILECGSYTGGSALYFASLCSLIGNGEVLTIDLEATDPRHAHPRVTCLQGSSVEPSVVAQVRERAAGKKVLVTLDSDHSYEHVTKELATYAGLVNLGGYLVIEDTNLPETKRAAVDFIAQHPEFEIDREQEKYLMTFNTWLRRTAL